MSEPRVSAVIVVHNGERYLAAAVESALAQRPRPSEVVVIDDGSTDGSRAVAQQFGGPVHCISQEWRGIAGARNAGVAASSGDYLAFLDADDLWTPEKTACQLRAFAADPALELAFGHVREFISPDVGRAMRRVKYRHGPEPGYLPGSALISRVAFERVGPFRADIRTGEFIDWMARAQESGVRDAIVDEHVLWRRIHEANHGLQHMSARVDYARILKAALDRRRRADVEAGRARDRS